MPSALIADWEAVHKDYMANVPLKEICKKHGVTIPALQGRRARGGWALERSRVKLEVKRRTKQALSSLDQEVRGKLGESIDEAVNTLMEIKCQKSLSHIKSRADVLQSLSATASKVFNWDKESNSLTHSINIALLQPPSPQPLPGPNTEIIDVEEVVAKELRQADGDSSTPDARPRGRPRK